jgi:hypothetical protein
MAQPAAQEPLNQIASTCKALRCALELTIGQRALFRADEWTPADRESDRSRKNYAQGREGNENNPSWFRH